MTFAIAIMAAAALVTAVAVPYWLRRLADARAAATAARERRRACRTGRTSGKVVSIERTGLSINDQPQVRIEIEVDLPDRVMTLTSTRIVDQLDIPRIQPGQTLRVQYDPDDVENLVLEIDDEFAAEDATAGSAPAISTTGMSFNGPLWTFGLHDPEPWLLPAPRSGPRPVRVMAFCDPSADERSSTDKEVIDGLHHVIAEAIRVETDAQVTSVALVSRELGKLVRSTGTLKDYDQWGDYLRTLETPVPILVWGAARRDLRSDGITARIRHPDQERDRTLTAPPADVIDFVVGLLVGEQWCERRDPPPWYVRPSGDRLLGYAVTLDDLQVQILSGPANAQVTLRKEIHSAMVEGALRLAEAGDEAAAHLVALAVASHAAKAGGLPDGLRDRVLALIERAGDDHPVQRLSPAVLLAFGVTEQARARRDRLTRPVPDGPFRSPADAYQDWLRRLPL